MLNIHLLSEKMSKCLDDLSRGSSTLKLYKELGFSMLFADRPPFQLFCFLEGGAGRGFPLLTVPSYRPELCSLAFKPHPESPKSELAKILILAGQTQHKDTLRRVGWLGSPRQSWLYF